MENLAQELTKIRKSMGLNQTEMAKKFGLAQRTWSSYETGRSEPPMEILFKLAKEGYVIHGLLGTSNSTEKTSETAAEDKKEAKVDLGNDLRKFRKEHDWTQKQISEKLGIPLTTWASWETGQSHPKYEVLSILRQMGLEITGLTSSESPTAPQSVVDYRLNELAAKRIANTTAAIAMLENAAKTIEAAVKLLKDNIGE